MSYEQSEAKKMLIHYFDKVIPGLNKTQVNDIEKIVDLIIKAAVKEMKEEMKRDATKGRST